MYHDSERSDGGESGGLMDMAATMIGCGVARARDDTSPRALECRQPMVHNCIHMRQLPRLCLPSCPYAAPHPELNCVFECTSQKSCGQVNVEFGYPNNVTRVCEPCSVVGCQECATPHRCKRCFPDFELALDGQFCQYVWDERMKYQLSYATVPTICLILLAMLVLTAVDKCGCCGQCLPQEAPPEGEDGMVAREAVEAAGGAAPSDASGHSGAPLMPELLEDPDDPMECAINQGKRHRLCCKIKDLELYSDGNDESTRIPRWNKIPFFVDLRVKFLAGVGLPLFHQWYYFLFLYSLMMCVGTAWVYEGSDFNGVLQKTGLARATHVLVGESGVSFCGNLQYREQVWEALKVFARRAAYGYAVLWLLGLILSIGFAKRQRRIATEFYRQHACLSEFTLNVEGFPPEATDEDQILRFFQETFGHSEIQVSVCYDFRRVRSRVHELLEKVLVLEDIKTGTYESSLETGRLGHGLRGLGLDSDDRAEVQDWVNPRSKNPLHNAGSVFVIFPHNYDLQHVKRKFEGTPSDYFGGGGAASKFAGSQHRASRASSSQPPALFHSTTPEWLPMTGPLKWVGADGKMWSLSIRDVVCEPPEIIWENLGKGPWMLTFHMFLGYLTNAASCGCLATFVFVPLAKYSFNYIKAAGSTPTGFLMTVLGGLSMFCTWLLLLFHIRVTGWVGYIRRDREGIMVFRSWTVQCAVSFIFNVIIMALPGTDKTTSGRPENFDLGDLSSDAMRSIEDVAYQVRVSVHLFHILVPCGLFVGYLMFPLQGFVWPFIQNLFYLRSFYGWTFGPKLTARKAEQALEPLGLSIGHDYMGQIVQPVSCSLMLFFATGVAWQTFGFLALWCLFMMNFMRYIHLRSTRRCYFTTNRVDTDVLFFWGFPLSMVAAASCYWAARLWAWPLYSVPLAFFFSAFLYAFLLTVLVQPHKICKDEVVSCCRPSYNDMRAQRFYDWHNCNPIKVLQSHCCQSAESSPIIPFVIGKEYLQANDPRWQQTIRRSGLAPGDTGQEPAPSDEQPHLWSKAMRGLSKVTNHVPEAPEVEEILSAFGSRFQRQRSTSSARVGNSERPGRVTPRDTSPPSATRATTAPAGRFSPGMRAESGDASPPSRGVSISGIPEGRGSLEEEEEEERAEAAGQPRPEDAARETGGSGPPGGAAAQVTRLKVVTEQDQHSSLSDVVREAAVALGASGPDKADGVDDGGTDAAAFARSARPADGAGATAILLPPPPGASSSVASVVPGTTATPMVDLLAGSPIAPAQEGDDPSMLSLDSKTFDAGYGPL